MSKYKVTDEVKFYVSTEYINSKREESLTLEDLDFYEDELSEMSDDEVEGIIQECYDSWLINNCDLGWFFINNK